jgi:hypothetical protein
MVTRVDGAEGRISNKKLIVKKSGGAAPGEEMEVGLGCIILGIAPLTP